MKSILERSLFWGVVLLSFLCAWRASAKSPVTVHKVFHHTAADKNCIELGSCVLYGTGFTTEPLKPQVTLSEDTETYRFFIPRVTVNDAECRRCIDAVNKQNTAQGYRMRIEELKKGVDGLAVSFTFPKHQCEVSCAYIDSIQREKGVMFRVYNRALMQSLKKQQIPVIRTAAVHTPPRIFIDAGHGGDDTGAVAQSGVSEKEVCLAVSKKVQRQLCDLGYSVCMSREADVPIPLDMRTYAASRYDADLVVSIHANAAPSNAAGIELFFLEPLLLTREHILSPASRAFLKEYYAARAEHNKKLAHAVHAEIKKQLPLHNPVFKDRGVKTALSQILLGVARPAVLIEIGFLTHPMESRLLADTHYQTILARAVTQGIHHYCVNMQV